MKTAFKFMFLTILCLSMVLPSISADDIQPSLKEDFIFKEDPVSSYNITYTTSGYSADTKNDSVNWMATTYMETNDYKTIENAITNDVQNKDAFVTYYGDDFAGKMFSVVVLYSNPLVDQLALGDWCDWKPFYKKMPIKLYAGSTEADMVEIQPTHFKTGAWIPSVYVEYMVDSLPAGTKYVKALLPATGNPNQAARKIGRITVTGDKKRLNDAWVNPYLPVSANDACKIKFEQLYSDGKEITALKEGNVSAKVVVANERSKTFNATLLEALYKNNTLIDVKKSSDTIYGYKTAIFSTEKDPLNIILGNGESLDNYNVKLWVITDDGAIGNPTNAKDLAPKTQEIDVSSYQKNRISVVSPKYTNEISGDTTVTIVAPGLKKISAKCWKQGDTYGNDSEVASVTLDDKGLGSFVFPANEYPHGPNNIRLSDAEGKNPDMCNLQVYNLGGVSWNEGLKTAPVPEAAKGLKVLFEDDFDGPLSISRWDSTAKYSSHKPRFQDFSGVYFMDYEDENRCPFGQVDTYLRIRADDLKNSTGILSTEHQDYNGVDSLPPAYFECKMVAQYAKGTWPAVWYLTDDKDVDVCDEYDPIEAYGFDDYNEVHTNSFHSGFLEHGRKQPTDPKVRNGSWIDVTKYGNGASWYTTFHTYGMYVGKEETIFYLDNQEMWRFPTWPTAKENPMYMLVNFAIGGSSGWPRDLSRYNHMADMYVDYIRIYN